MYLSLAVRLNPLICPKRVSVQEGKLFFHHSLVALALTDNTYCEGVIPVSFLKCLEK